MILRPLTHRERMESCLFGENVDRIPVALWRHFPVDDQSPGSLAAATSSFQKLYDFDFIKVTPSSSFCIRDYGAEDIWKGSPEGTRDYQGAVIHNPEDWEKLPVLHPRRDALGMQVECLQLLVPQYFPHTPIIQTIFSPLSQAKNLVGKNELLVHIRKNPDALKLGLERITENTIAFIEEILKTGVDGIFYAVQHAQFGLLGIDEFRQFQMAYDLRILKTVQTKWLNVGHIHGEDIMFDEITSYPLNVLNWHDQHTFPSLGESQKRFKGAVCGGLRRWETMVLGNPDKVREEAMAAATETGGCRFILGTGCVLPIVSPHGNILAASRSFQEDVH